MDAFHNAIERLQIAWSLIKDGDSYFALAHIVGLEWSLFLHVKVYRKVLILLWRMRTIHYPVRYRLSNYLKKTSKEYFNNFQFPKILQTPFLSKERSHGLRPIDSDPNIFPMEIWEEIVSYNVNPGNLIRLNKDFCDTFAPRVYSELKLYLAISDTKKMRLNDACFLKYGPDFLEDWPRIDSYAIYERHQKSQHYEFEFLDVSKGPQEGNESDYHNSLITNHNKALHILKYIMANPNAFLKRYVKDISVTAQILHGRRELLETTMPNGFSLKDYLDGHIKRKQNARTELAGITPYFALCVQNVYKNDRWEGNVPIIRESTYIGRQRERYFTKKEFPQRVYTKELLGVAIMLNYLQTGKNWKTIRNAQRYSKFSEVNPFLEYQRYMISEFGPIPPRGVGGPLRTYRVTSAIDLGQKEIRATNINSREFYTAEDVRDVLYKISNALTCDDTNGEVNCLFILSYSTSEDEYEPEYRRTLIYLPNRNHLQIYSPETTFIHKPKKIGGDKFSPKLQDLAKIREGLDARLKARMSRGSNVISLH